MTYYYDTSKADGPIAFFHGAEHEVIYCGTEIHQEAEQDRALGESYLGKKISISGMERKAQKSQFTLSLKLN